MLAVSPAEVRLVRRYKRRLGGSFIGVGPVGEAEPIKLAGEEALVLHDSVRRDGDEGASWNDNAIFQGEIVMNEAAKGD